MLRGFVGWLGGLFVAAVVCLVVNSVAVPLQHWWKRGDRARHERISAELANNSTRIHQMETELSSLADQTRTSVPPVLIPPDARRQAQLNSLKQDIKQIESHNPNGIPADIYDGYVDLVNHYNRLGREHKADIARYNREANKANRRVDLHNKRVRRYKELRPKYEEMVQHYNKQVDEANRLAAGLGTWYVMPLPGVGGGGSKSRTASNTHITPAPVPRGVGSELSSR